MEAVKQPSGNYFTKSKTQEPNSKADNNGSNNKIKTKSSHVRIVQTDTETRDGNHENNRKSKESDACCIMIESSFLFISHDINSLK